MIAALSVRNLGRVSRIKARRPLRALRNFHAVHKLKRSKFPLDNFKAKYLVYQSTSQFILKTAETPFELRQVLQLRHNVFYRELQSRQHETKLDFDEFDAVCDHLIIIDRKSRRVVGTYRLICSSYSDRFYSQGEFTLQGVLALPGSKLELGRACIDPEFRTGAILNLLWKGIAEYIKLTDSQYLFGCASVQTMDQAVARRLRNLLRAKGLSQDEFGIEPTPAYRPELFFGEQDLDHAYADSLEDNLEEAEKEIPPLVQSYILAGAKFYGSPALDTDFQCFDFFMMLKISELSRLFRRRYF